MAKRLRKATKLCVALKVMSAKTRPRTQLPQHMRLPFRSVAPSLSSSAPPANVPSTPASCEKGCAWREGGGCVLVRLFTGAQGVSQQSGHASASSAAEQVRSSRSAPPAKVPSTPVRGEGGEEGGAGMGVCQVL